MSNSREDASFPAWLFLGYISCVSPARCLSVYPEYSNETQEALINQDRDYKPLPGSLFTQSTTVKREQVRTMD